MALEKSSQLPFTLTRAHILFRSFAMPKYLFFHPTTSASPSPFTLCGCVWFYLFCKWIYLWLFVCLFRTIATYGLNMCKWLSQTLSFIGSKVESPFQDIVCHLNLCLWFASLAHSVSVSACFTLNPYGYNTTTTQTHTHILRSRFLLITFFFVFLVFTWLHLQIESGSVGRSARFRK